MQAREHAIPCMDCGRPTWRPEGYCDVCDADAYNTSVEHKRDDFLGGAA